MKQVIIILSLFYLSVFFVNAQDRGTIRGNITDKETGEAIVGAMVIIEETEPAIVTLSDYDGNYSLENVPVNAKKFTVSFLSYKTQIIENLHLIPGNTEILNLILEKIAEDIDEVVVSAKSITNTDAAINTVQKNSAGIINGVSSQQMSKLGDSDAASALKRVAGISVSGGKYVFIRGLSDRYSKVTLNGAEIPGLDPNKNTVQMDMFPSNIIDNIIVHKSFTPDLPASFTGGYINVTTKSYPEKFTLHFSNSIGYNSQANLNENFISYEGGKYDALGIDDGIRNIPEQANDIPAIYQNDEKLAEISKSFNKIMSTSTKKSFLNHGHSLSIGNQIKLFGKPFGFILSASYDRKFKYYDNGLYAKYDYTHSQNSSGVMNLYISEKEKKGEEDIMLSLLGGFSYKLNRNNSLNISILKNSSGLKSARYREGPRPEDDIYMHEHTLGFQERNFTSAQVSGKHILTNFLNIRINWISSYTLSKQNEPDLRFFSYDNTGINSSAYAVPARFYRFMTENNADNKLKFEIPLNIKGKSAKIKFGAANTYKSRNSDEKKFDIFSQGIEFNGNISEYISDENIIKDVNNSPKGIYIGNDTITDRFNSYQAKENVMAAFGMIDIDITKKLKIITGARFENNSIFVENKVPTYHHKYKKAERIYPDILPVFNTRYSVNKNMNLRFVYSKTVGRPAFREIAPYAVYDFKEGWRVVGNPDLQRTIIDNFDLRWEKFGMNGDIISASVFYKYFKNPIELVDDARATNTEFHYVNIDNSKLYGIEFEFKQHLGFINLHNFMIGSNITVLKSEVEFPVNSNTEESAILKRPMYEQAPWVVNAFLSYDNKEFGLNSNVSFNMEGDKLAVVIRGDAPDIYKRSYPNLKFNISKTIGKNFSVKFSIKNILDRVHKKTYDIEDKEYIFQSYSLGRTYSFSVSYNIN